MNNEEYYDKEVMPLLKALSIKLQNRGMSIIALVEFNPGDIGNTVGTASAISPDFHALISSIMRALGEPTEVLYREEGTVQ